VLKGKADRWPDLLLITQHESSNHNLVRAFFVQKGILLPVVWRISRKEKQIAQYVSRGWPVKRLHDNLYQTSYWSPEDGFHLLTWRFEPKGRRILLLSDLINNN
jgi:hypothetical protein